MESVAVNDLRIGTVGPGARKLVVNEVSFAIEAGKTLCLVGESGSGKSVTALAIMGLLPKRSLEVVGGSALIGGEDALMASDRRLREMRATRMAMVFQEPMTALNPVETVGRQIEEVLLLHTTLDRRERRERVLAMLDSVRLPDVRKIFDAYPHQLSGGQRQRIVISIALVLEPLLLIADEPTTALDVTTQRQILNLIRELQDKHNTAVLLVTHDFGVVSEVADQIAVMNRGRIVEAGSRHQILGHPRDPYTRALISAVPSLIPKRSVAPTGPVVLDVVDLEKTYSSRRFLRRGRSVHAAKDINFQVRRGEIIGVVGESGSGKSTVARCIARLLPPTGGSVSVRGIDLARLSGAQLRQSRSRVQIVFQDPYRSLNPRRRIQASMIEGLTNYGMEQAAAIAKAAELLRLVDLDPDVMSRYPHQFSGGQRQRICIARALALEPDILVADEAVSALDVSVQAKVLKLLEEIRQRSGIALVFITHDLRVAAQICDTIVVMREGVIVETGTAETVLSTPQHEYTQILLQAAPGRGWDFQKFRAVEEASTV